MLHFGIHAFNVDLVPDDEAAADGAPAIDFRVQDHPDVTDNVSRVSKAAEKPSMAGDALNVLGFYHYRLSKNKLLTPENIFVYSYYTLAKKGGFSVSEIVAMLNAISKDLDDIVVSETNKNVFDPTPHTDVVVAKGKVPRGGSTTPKRSVKNIMGVDPLYFFKK